MPPNRTLRLPPTDLSARTLLRTRQTARPWFRVHQSAHHAINFSLNPTHRFSHPSCACKILYVAIDPQTCFWECFGDRLYDGGHSLPKTVWDDASLSTIDVPPLEVCDLASAATRGALVVDLTALMNDDLAIPQAWGLAIQNHPSQVPAIKFKSRFTGSACLAIFERVTVSAQLTESLVAPLNQCPAALDWLAKTKVALV
jgi:hypothetical protein